jgi:hypothetical protein
VRLNLFEPRWLILFAKLMAEKMPLVLLGTGENRINLARDKTVQAYEAGDDEAYDIVPGRGRMDETDFVGTRWGCTS